MASGDLLMLCPPLAASPTVTLPAGLRFIADASTPNATIPVLTFADGTAAWANFFFTMPDVYDGGGLTISWKGGTDNTSTGTLELEVRAIVIADPTILTGDLGFDTATAAAITDTPPATPTDKLNYSTTGTLSHANAGSPTGGTSFMGIAITRDYTTDTNTGTMQVAEVVIKET